MAVSFVPILAKSSSHQDGLKHGISFISTILQCINICCLMILLLYFIVKHKSFIEDGRVEFPKGRISNINANSTNYFPALQDGRSYHSPSFHMIFFGIVSIIYIICYLVKVIMEHETDVKTAEIVDNSVTVGCIILAIIFLRRYEEASLKSCRFFQYSIALMMGANAWVWIFVTVKPLWTFSIHNTNGPLNIFGHSDTGTSFHLNSTIAVVEMVETFLQPFFVEFLSISAGCVLSLWFTMRDDPRSHIEYEQQFNRETGINEQNEHLPDYRALLDQSESENSLLQGRCDTTSRSHKYLKYIVIAASVFIGIGYWAASEILEIGPLTFILEKHLSKTTRSVLTKIIIGLVYLPLVVMNFISIHKLQRSSDDIPQMKHFTTSDLLLLITSAGYFVYFILRSIANINIFINDREPEYILYLVISTGTLEHIWAQTQFIMTSHYVHRSVNRLPKTAEITLIYVAVINLVEWLCLAVSHKWIESDPTLDVFNPELVASFGNYNTAIILLILNPIMEIYRFHSVVVAYESLQKK